MKLKNSILIISIILIFISLCGAYATITYQNSDNISTIPHEDDGFGCCSIVLQDEGNSSIMCYRRDANLTADIFIEQIDWHGHKAIKQYKTNGGYFNHVIITSDGWIIGFGGVDDGIDSERCENITAKMITEDYSISEDLLTQIQQIKEPYGKGHVVVKAPNGNYGFATPQKIKTGTLSPGQYVSIPNTYYYSRGGDISLDNPDKIKTMHELSQSDAFGLNRREIVTYVFNCTEEGNTTDIYISNDDGSYFGLDNLYDIDDIKFNNTTYKGQDIPIAPKYKQIGTISFPAESHADNLTVLLSIIAFVVFVGILAFVVLRFVRILTYRIRYKK